MADPSAYFVIRANAFGLAWSESGDAVVYEQVDSRIGLTHSFREEIALFIEGYAAERALPDFTSLLLLMMLFRDEVYDRRTAELFSALSRPWRNAGTLAARLTIEDAMALEAPPVEALLLHLRRPSGVLRSAGRSAAMSLSPRHWERVRRRLRAVDDEELCTWLEHGRSAAPDDEGAIESLVETLPPETMGDPWEAVLQSPRLAWARSMLPALEGALALPAWPAHCEEVRVGGYADLSNRGDIERILPAQLALEPDEFLRRFAERELLYYERESPQVVSQRGLVLILDQGVRTWGDTRIILASAALALARRAYLEGRSLELFSTGRPEPIDPRAVVPEQLVQFFAASDLSLDPSRALESAGNLLTAPCDFVLLTHKRNLDEAQVQDAARAFLPPTRLFAAAIDESGEVELSRIAQGGSIAISRCRITQPKPSASSAPKPREVCRDRWSGTIELLPLPFTLPVEPAKRISDVCFSNDGDEIYFKDERGLFHAIDAATGSTIETAPRPFRLGRGNARDTQERSIGLLPVPGGWLDVSVQGDRVVLCWYRPETRQVKTCVMVSRRFETQGWSHLFFDRESSAIGIVNPRTERAALLPLSGCLDYDREAESFRSRVSQWEEWLFQGPGSLFAQVARNGVGALNRLIEMPDGLDPAVGHFGGEQVGVIQLSQAGRRRLDIGNLNPEYRKNRWPASVFIRRGGALAVRVLENGDEGEQVKVIDLNTMHVRAAALLERRSDRIDLSRDGKKLLVLCAGDGPSAGLTMRVHDLDAGAVATFPVMATAIRETQVGFAAPRTLLMGSGSLWYSVAIGGDSLRIDRLSPFPDAPVQSPIPGPDTAAFKLGYPDRIRDSATGSVHLLSDIFGQVIVLECATRRPIAMFLPASEGLAGMLFDGTLLGPEAITGAPESPGALERFAAAFRKALGGAGQ